jgi:hypothetical protein
MTVTSRLLEVLKNDDELYNLLREYLQKDNRTSFDLQWLVTNLVHAHTMPEFTDTELKTIQWAQLFSEIMTS